MDPKALPYKPNPKAPRQVLPVLPPESGGLSRKGSFTLAADGSLAGDIDDVFNGVDAARERGILKERDAKEVHNLLEEGLSVELPGLNFKGYEFHDSGDLEKSIGLDLHVSATSYAHPAGPLLLLRPRVMGTNARTPPDLMESKTRKYPIEIGHPGLWRSSYDITLPAGYAVDETPDPVDVDMDFASYHASASAKGNVLHYEMVYTVRQVEIPADRAADFRKLESAILSDEKGTAVLKKQ